MQHWAPILFPWGPLTKTCARWGKGAGKAESRRFSKCMGHCFSPFSSCHKVVYSPSPDRVTFLSTLPSIPQPHRGITMDTEMCIKCFGSIIDVKWTAFQWRELCSYNVISSVQVDNDVKEKVKHSFIKTFWDFPCLTASLLPCDSLCLSIQEVKMYKVIVRVYLWWLWQLFLTAAMVTFTPDTV